MRISDWSSDVCSSDLVRLPPKLVDHRATDAGGCVGGKGRHAAFLEIARRLQQGDGTDLHQIAHLYRRADMAVDMPRDLADTAQVRLHQLLCRRAGGGRTRIEQIRAEERREGKACVGTCRTSVTTAPYQ